MYNDGKLYYKSQCHSVRCPKKEHVFQSKGVKFEEIRITSTLVASINQLTVAVASKGTLSPVVTWNDRILLLCPGKWIQKFKLISKIKFLMIVKDASIFYVGYLEKKLNRAAKCWFLRKKHPPEPSLVQHRWSEASSSWTSRTAWLNQQVSNVNQTLGWHSIILAG